MCMVVARILTKPLGIGMGVLGTFEKLVGTGWGGMEPFSGRDSACRTFVVIR